MPDIFYSILTFAIPTLFAITVHEAAHAYCAKWMGDKTAFLSGRCTLNPIPHLDYIGTLLVPSLAMVLGGVLFGWAKPVPINPTKMRYPKKSPMWVAMAGPFSNFLMALGWGIFAFWLSSQPAPEPFLVAMGKAGIQVNLILMIFNLLPLPPLDGSKLVGPFLPRRIQPYWQTLERWGFIILLLLVLSKAFELLWLKPWMQIFSWIPAMAH